VNHFLDRPEKRLHFEVAIVPLAIDNNYGAIGHSGKWQPPNRSSRIAEQTQSVSSSRLIARWVVACRDKRAEHSFYLGQGNVLCSGSILVRRTRSEKQSDSHPSTIRFKNEELRHAVWRMS
jgi:hypothetical protein